MVHGSSPATGVLAEPAGRFAGLGDAFGNTCVNLLLYQKGKIKFYARVD